MTTKRIIAVSSIVGMLSLSGSGVALGDSVSIDTTGPGSFNSATINETNTLTETNVNNVTVTNTNNQTATSGAASSSFNTNGGSAMTGNASNNNSTSTTVAINNPGIVIGSGNAGVPGAGNGGGNTGGGSGNGGVSVSGGAGSGGSRLLGAGSGSAGVGEALTLPQTGPNGQVDVSALRNQPLNASAPASSIVKKTNGFSTMLLVIAAALSLLGAVGSAVFSIRQKRTA